MSPAQLVLISCKLCKKKKKKIEKSFTLTSAEVSVGKPSVRTQLKPDPVMTGNVILTHAALQDVSDCSVSGTLLFLYIIGGYQWPCRQKWYHAVKTVARKKAIESRRTVWFGPHYRQPRVRSDRKVFSVKPEFGVIVCFSLSSEWHVIVILALQILNILGCTDNNLLFVAYIDKMTSKFRLQAPNLSFTHTWGRERPRWKWERMDDGICRTFFFPCGSCVLRSCSLTLLKHVGLSYLLCLLRVRKPTAYSSGKQPHGVTRTRQTSDLKK